MGLEAWLTLAVIAAMVLALVRGLVGPAPAVLTACVVLYLLGVTTTEQAFSGFSNPAPLTVAALYVLARAVRVTGALEPITNRLLAGRPGSGRPASERRPLARLLPPVALASGVFNNTPVVAMVAPQLTAQAPQRGLRASRMLMPLSYAAILGGLLTTVGTSTTLVVSGMLQDAGAEPLGLLEITGVGLPVAVVGLAVVVLLVPRLVPDRSGADELADHDRVRRYSIGMLVEPGGALDGRTAAEGGLRDLQGVYLAQIDRGERIVAPVAPDERLQGGDVLSFVGKVDQVVDLQRMRGLTTTEEHHLGGLDGFRGTFFEAVVGPGSSLHGRTLKDAQFRQRFGGVVVAINRAGERVDAKLGQVPLQSGDTLLVLADPGFADRWRDSADFLLVARQGGSAPAMTRKAPLVGLVAAGMLLLAGTGVLSILQAALAAAGALIVLRIVSPSQAIASVDLHVVLTIAAALGVGKAVTASGLADVAGGLVVDAAAPLGALGALALVMLATIVITELVTNNGAAVLLLPVALAAAETAGADPRPFAIAVALCASASFLSPLGYQTNLMVYGLGGYRFTDFVRAGAPLTLTVLAVGLIVIPTVWPL